jgi:hypothetical protein
MEELSRAEPEARVAADVSDALSADFSPSLLTSETATVHPTHERSSCLPSRRVGRITPTVLTGGDLCRDPCSRSNGPNRVTPFSGVD